MLKPIATHDRLQIARRPEKPEARFLEPSAAMLLGKGQRSRRRVGADVAAELVLADELQPLEAVPVRRHEHMLRHGRRIAFAARVRLLGHRVGVDVVEHGAEHPGLHVVDLDWAASPRALLPHRAEELRIENRGPGREHEPVRGEGLPADPELDVGFRAGREETAEVLVQVWRRPGDELWGVLCSELLGDDDIAPDTETIIFQIG